MPTPNRVALSSESGRRPPTEWPWIDNGAEVIQADRVSRERIIGAGALTAYQFGLSNGLFSTVYHGTSSERPVGLSSPITYGTAPSLGLNAEGVAVHEIINIMKRGGDGIVFGPGHISPGRDIEGMSQDELENLARQQTSVADSAFDMHRITDGLAEIHGEKIDMLLWGGVSKGAVNGLAYAALAPKFGREVVYGNYAVPVWPYPSPEEPTKDGVRKAMAKELPSFAGVVREIIGHDIKLATGKLRTAVEEHRRPKEMLLDTVNPLRVHYHLASLAIKTARQPSLLHHYGRSRWTGREAKAYIQAWAEALCNGDAGIAAANIKQGKFTIESFDKDPTCRIEDWSRRLEEPLESGRARVVEFHGRHSDAARLSHQKRRWKDFGHIIDQLSKGVSPEDIEHPKMSSS